MRRAKCRRGITLCGMLRLLAVVVPCVALILVPLVRVNRYLRFMQATAEGDTAEVRRLLAAGVSPESTHIEGSSALWWAVASGHVGPVQVLLEHGADPNSRGQWNSVIQQAACWAGEGGERRRIAQLLATRAAQIRDPADRRLIQQAAADRLRSHAADQREAGARSPTRE